MCNTFLLKSRYNKSINNHSGILIETGNYKLYCKKERLYENGRNCKEKRRWSLAPSGNYGSFDAERLDIADIWNNYRVRDKSFGNLFGYDVGLDFY